MVNTFKLVGKYFTFKVKDINRFLFFSGHLPSLSKKHWHWPAICAIYAAKYMVAEDIVGS